MALSTEERILERLDQILRVLAIQVGEDLSITERTRLLKLTGMDNHTIAQVLNTTDATVRALTSNLRRRPPVKKGRAVRKKTTAKRRTE